MSIGRSATELEDVCAVVVPSGRARTGRRSRFFGVFRRHATIDYDAVFYRILKSAIERTRLPEGGRFRAVRLNGFLTQEPSDRDIELFEYARIVLADISCLAPAITRDILIRQRVQDAGTVVLRALDAGVRTDLDYVRATPYDASTGRPIEEAEALVHALVKRAAGATGRLTVVQQASRKQYYDLSDHEDLLVRATLASRGGRHSESIRIYREAVGRTNRSALLGVRLALEYEDDGRVPLAIELLSRVVDEHPEYAEARRELGRLLTRQAIEESDGEDHGHVSDGTRYLDQAIADNPLDYRARMILADHLAGHGQYDSALRRYCEATETSHGNPAALLKEFEMSLRAGFAPTPDEGRGRFARNGIRVLESQLLSHPPIGLPKAFFDLAQLHLFLGQAGECVAAVRSGVDHCTSVEDVEHLADVLRLYLAAPLSERNGPIRQAAMLLEDCRLRLGAPGR